MKICFLVSADIDLLADAAEIQVALGDVETLSWHLGQPVLLFSEPVSATPKIVGMGRFEGLTADRPAKSHVKARIEQIEFFAQQVPMPFSGALVHENWRGVDDSVFADVTKGQYRGLEEAAPPFAFELEELEGLERKVLLAYGFTCALTGQAGHDGEIVPVVIKPLSAGGRAEVSNWLALSLDVAEAFAGYQVTIGDDLEIIADLAKISPEIVARLNPSGRLRQPALRESRPSKDALCWHARQFSRFNGLV